MNEVINTSLKGGIVGIFLDGRGRQPFIISDQDNDRVNSLLEWSKISNEYPEGID